MRNLYHGHGTYTFPDGSYYEGPFVENQMHGPGCFTDKQVRQWPRATRAGSRSDRQPTLIGSCPSLPWLSRAASRVLAGCEMEGEILQWQWARLAGQCFSGGHLNIARAERTEVCGRDVVVRALR